MKWLWTHTKQLADDWFNLIVIGILCAGALAGVYVQGYAYDVRVKHLQELHDSHVDIYKGQYEQMRTASDELFKVYSQEKANSDVKDQIIEKQHNIIRDLFKRLDEYKKWFDGDSAHPKNIT